MTLKKQRVIVIFRISFLNFIITKSFLKKYLMSKPINQIISFLFIAVILISSCKSNEIEYADIVFKGGTIYTVNEDSPVAEAVAVMN